MKELLTKKFWQDVKNTFEDAQKEDLPLETEPPVLLDSAIAVSVAEEDKKGVEVAQEDKPAPLDSVDINPGLS